MSYQTMPDEQIIQQIANSLDKKRRKKGIASVSLAKKGGHGVQTYSNFVNQGKDIRLSTFIQILRGLGELDKLEEMLEDKEAFSPTGKKVPIPKRIRTKTIVRNQDHEGITRLKKALDGFEIKKTEKEQQRSRTLKSILEKLNKGGKIDE